MRLGGERIGPTGAKGLVAWLGSMCDGGRVQAEAALGDLIGVDLGRAGAMDLALCLRGIAMGVLLQPREGRGILSRNRRAILKGEARRCFGELLSKRDANGAWDGPVATAWCLSALQSAAMVDETLWEAGTEACRGVVLPPAPAQDASGAGSSGYASDVLRLHDASARATMLRFLGRESHGGGWEEIASRVRAIGVGEDPAVLVSWAFAYWEIGPSRSRRHPCVAAKERLKDAYQSGRLEAAGPSELGELVTAVELFGFDEFGASMGYIPQVDDRWGD